MTSSFADKFERLVDLYRRSDGERWTPRQLDEATGGYATQAYIANLRSGRIRRPGYDKLKAIAQVMEFPVSLWYEDPGDWQRLAEETKHKRGPSLADRLELLMDISKNDVTGEPFKEEEVVRLSLGNLSLEEVRRMRSGELTNPTMSQLYALSDVFGVDVRYWLLEGDKVPALTSEDLEAINDDKSKMILNMMHGRSEGEKDMILTVIKQLDRLQGSNGPPGLNPSDPES